MRKTLLVRNSAVLLLCLSGCSAIDALSDLIGDCGDLSFSDVQQQNGISDECREAIDSLLPEAQDNFSSRLVLLGAGTEGSNPVLYLQGVSSSGSSLTAADFESAAVTVTQGGTETVLQASEFAVESLSEETDGVVSLALVTDYSASMAESDIDDSASIFEDLLAVLPSAIFEGEVAVFSDEVTVRQEFSEDESAVTGAVARDDAIERGATALYDGMGQVLEDLVGRSRPIKVLVVSTDGLENASQNFSKDQVLALIEENHVLTVMIGTLLSDVSELEDLAGSQGVFFYARTYLQAKDRMQTFFGSVENAAKITLDEAYQDADSVRVEAQGLALEIDL